MDLLLKRNSFDESGVFGVLSNNDESETIAITLEHAYESSNGIYIPKIPDGSYVCVRGTHQLIHMKNPFETFEITNIHGHTNILFHVGNVNEDSEGCVLLGKERQGSSITESRLAFSDFMNRQQDLDSFNITIVSPNLMN